MTIQLDVLQTAGLAALLFFMGSKIKSKSNFLQKYFIPAPVIGGLIFSLLAFIGVRNNLYSFEMDSVLQDFFMNVFFTAVGFECSIYIVKKSGILGMKLAVVAILLLVFQNLLGASLARLFGINPLLGVAMGSVSMSGGVGSAVAFGPDFEALGAAGGTAIGTAAATFGLLVGSIIGGPVAKRLIEKKNLKTNENLKNIETTTSEKTVLNKASFLKSFLLVVLTGALGSIISLLLNKTGLKFPYYVGCLFAGAIVRNVADYKNYELKPEEIGTISSFSLNLFLSMALMQLNIAKIVSLAIPMFVILLSETLLMAIYAYFITFKTCGSDYEAAVIAAGHCGVGLGQTPNAIANMTAVTEKHGPAPTAWFVLPVITVIFINIFNPIIITAFMNILS